MTSPFELDEVGGSPPGAGGGDDATLQLAADETLQLPGSTRGRPAEAPPVPGEAAETVVLAGGAVEGPVTVSLPGIPSAGEAEAAPSPLDELVVVADAGAPEAEPPEITRDVAAGATGPRPPSSKPRPLPAGRLLAGAAALFVLAAATVGWLLWQRTAPARSGPDAVPAPPPLVSDAQAVPVPILGSLRVTSEPGGARVTVNGEERGATPLDLEELPLGVYEVGVELKGHEPQTRDVALTAGEPSAAVEVTLSRRQPTLGRVNFASTPPGAEVSVDGKVVGKAPVTDVRLRPGSHRVQMTLDGHARWAGAVEVTAGRQVSLEAPLAPLAAATATTAPTPEPVDTTRVYENKAGDVDHLARKKSGDSPSYPSGRAPRLKSGERVSVTFSFVVTETGEVEGLTVEESAGKVIDDVVVEAVGTWKFEPATIRGTPVRVRIVRKQTFLGG